MSLKGGTVTKIIDYETGGMAAEEIVEFFGELIKSGLAWQLQGHYGRMATQLIETGYLDKDGKILKEVGNE